jgi:hypothetical protein
MRKAISTNYLLGFALTLAVACGLNAAEQVSTSTAPANSSKEAQEVKRCKDLANTVWLITANPDKDRNEKPEVYTLAFYEDDFIALQLGKAIGDPRGKKKAYEDENGMCKLEASIFSFNVNVYMRAYWEGKIMIGTISFFDNGVGQIVRRVPFASVNEVRPLEVPLKTPASVPEHSPK